MSEKQNGFNPGGFKESFNMATGVMSIIAMCFIPIFRRGQGREGFGLRAFFALLLMLCIGGLGHAPEMLPYIGIWLLFVVYRRLQTMWLLRKGTVIHSQYWGDTNCPVRLPGMTKEQTGKVVEVLACGGAAFWVAPYYPVFGYFCAVGAVSLAFTGILHNEAHRRRAQAMEDARIENEWLAGRYRERG